MRKANKNLYLVRTMSAVGQKTAAKSSGNQKSASHEKRKAEHSDEVQS